MLQSVNFWLQLIKFSFYLVLRGIHGHIWGIRIIRFLAAYVFQLYLDDRPFSMIFFVFATSVPHFGHLAIQISSILLFPCFIIIE